MMFEKYLANKEDLNTIEEALKYIWSPKLNFVFKDKTKIENTLIISYDSKSIYLWSPISKGKYELQEYPHKLRIKDELQEAWWAGPVSEKILECLPGEFKDKNRFKRPVINGGLLTPFVRLQKAKKIPNNPYTTTESYLATIIHELGHVYWNSHKLWWFSDKEKNLEYLRTAFKLYNKKIISIPNISFPVSPSISEIFAFCTEYHTSSIFWLEHKKKLDKYISNIADRLIKEEKKKDLEIESSMLEPSKFPHNFSFVFGKIILQTHPATWPTLLTSKS